MYDYLLDENGRFLIQPDAGLGNRLYCLYSSLYYSRLLEKNFDVLWLREMCCNVPFEALFRPIDNVKVCTTYDLGYKNRYVFKTLRTKSFMKKLKGSYDYYTAEDTRDIYNRDGERGIIDLISQKHGNGLCIKANGRFIDKEHFAEVANLVKPAEEIEDCVNAAMTKKCIGIHIRRTDNKRSIESSPTELFIKLLDRLSSENKDICFFLATDDNELDNELRKKYNILSREFFAKEKSRSLADGMKDAYADMLCLSRCDKIYGSFGSSFSEMASIIGNVPLEIVKM